MPNFDTLKMNYKIIKVDPAAYSLNIPEDFVYDKDTIKINGNTQIKLEVIGAENKLNVIIDIIMAVDYVEKEHPSFEVFTLKAITTFKIDDVSRHLENLSTIELSDAKIAPIIKISIDHARGIQSAYLKGTPISKFTLPDINLMKVKEVE